MTLTPKTLTAFLSVPTALMLSTAIHAENTSRSLQIPAGQLSTALNRLAEASDLQMVYDTDMTQGLKSPALSGNYTPTQALHKLLQGSGLGYQLADNGTVNISRQAPSASLQNSNSPLAEAVAQNSDADEKEITLPLVKVQQKDESDSIEDPANNPHDDSYRSANTASSTKTDTPLMATPQSIQVIPRVVIDDQKTPRIKDALENVSGVRPQPSLGTGTNFIIRGFPNNSRIYRNGLGLINGFGGLQTDFDTGNLQSIEVLKGPSSMLYGRSEPGGLINVTTKAPLDTPYYALEQQFGSYDFYRTLWDATGPIAKDHSLLYRFSGAYQDNNSFRDFVTLNRNLISPSFTWRPSDATELNVNVEGMEQEFKADYGIPVIGTRPAPIPISRSMDDPNTPLAHDSHVYFNTNLSHRLNNNWTLRNRFLASWSDNDSTFVNPTPAFGSALQADNRTLSRNIFRQEAMEESYITNLDLLGKFALWQTQHEVLVGFDFTQGNSRYGYFGDYNTSNPALDLDIYNPRYGIDPSLFNSVLSSAVGDPNNLSFAKLEWFGLYFQDHITLWERLHIMGGGRYDWAEKGRAFAPSYDEAEKLLAPTIRRDDAFSPRVGILYEAQTWLSVYGNWTNSFGANNGLNGQGLMQPPESAEQYEAGIKTELFDKRLTSTLAFYHLTKQNLLTPDLSTPNQFDTIAIGEARSRGVEFDMTGKITDALSLIASYAYTDARATRDNSGLQGKRLNNVPEHSGSVWLRHDLTAIPSLKGLSLGIGAYLATKREGDADNTFQLPGYVRLDTFAAYRWTIGKSRLTAQLNVRNLLDKQYYESTDPFSNVAPRLGVYPGSPLTVLGSLRMEF